MKAARKKRQAGKTSKRTGRGGGKGKILVKLSLFLCMWLNKGTLNPYSGYPSANPSNLPIATKMADQVLCLPMHHALTKDDVENIINCIQK